MAKKNKSVVRDEEDLDEDDEDSEDEEGADKEDLDEDEEDDDDDEEDDGAAPKVRHNLSQIIARKNRKIAKLEGQGGGRSREEDIDDEEDDDKRPKRTDRVATEALGTMARELDRKQVDIDISTFLADPRNVKFRRYEKKARRYALHPSRAQVPIASIFRDIAFDDFSSEQEADVQARRDRAERGSARGSSFRKPPTSDTEKVRNMNFQSKDFQSLRQRIGAGETINLEEEE